MVVMFPQCVKACNTRSEVSPNDMGKTDQYKTLTKHKQAGTMCMFFGM